MNISGARLPVGRVAETDANGVYLTTNEYSLFGSGYNGAQIYALPKTALYAGPTVPVTQVENTSTTVDAAATMPAMRNDSNSLARRPGTLSALVVI